MGWNSTRDPSRGLRLKFRNLDTAIEFCKKNGILIFVYCFIDIVFTKMKYRSQI